MSFKICMIFFCVTQKQIFWRMLVTESFWFPSIFIYGQEKPIARSVNQNCLVTNILQIIFCFKQKKIRWLNNDRIFIYELTILLTYL